MADKELRFAQIALAVVRARPEPEVLLYGLTHDGTVYRFDYHRRTWRPLSMNPAVRPEVSEPA